VSDTTITLDILGITPSSASGTITATDRYQLPLTYSVSTAPAEGTAVAAADGGITYTVDGLLSSPTKSTDSFVITVSNSYTSSTANVNVTLRYDPLLPNQWHLSNTGQDVFSSTRPVAGNDMRVGAAWAEGVSGKGVKVAVVDDGLEVTHEDLKDNFDLENSFNFLTNEKNPTPAEVTDDHGTQVAGIIGASAFNGQGGRGVAYGATLRGYNLLEDGAYGIANLATALGGGTGVAADNDLFNASFGARVDPQLPFLPEFDSAQGATNAGTLSLRDGKGAPLVEAAGNSFEDFSSPVASRSCVFANEYKVSCSITASDTRKASTIPIIVGALAADGKKASYSTTGSSIWISAPAGESGFNNAFAPGLPENLYEPAITTTTRTGCDSKGNATNPLNSKNNDLAASCQYTAQMNGTSAAAPNAAGVVALMLEARPELTWRDVKFILAKTAIQVDRDMAPISLGSLVLEQGWVENAAGFSFNNWYGFGAVDAGAAVKMAKTHNLLPPQKQAFQVEVRPPVTTTIAAGTSYSLDFTVNSTEMTVNEGIVVYADFDTGAVFCNQVELQSPAGTKSIILHAATGFTNSYVANVRFATNAFYGEPINGVWKMTFWNVCTSAVSPTQLYNSFPQTLLFVGR
jgi:subtilisin family serine protease